MRNWLLTFSPDTYEKVQQPGMIGVLKHLFCRGGFIESPASDYDYLRGILGGAEVGGSLHLA